MELINDINDVKATFSNNKLVNVVFSLNTKAVGDSTSKDCLFFGNVERSSTFDETSLYNKNCLYATDENGLSDHLIRNMYASDNCFYKSAIYDASKTCRSNTTYDFQNITNHKMSSDHTIDMMIQTDNIMYGLEPKSKYGRYNITCDIYSYISANNGYILPPNVLISTAIYDVDAISTAIEADDIDKLQQTAVSANLSNIQYNIAYEIPGNVFNDYESGNIAANTFKCKNSFNSIYNMEHDKQYVLKNARDYNRIDNCNNQVYLTYHDNICYPTTTTDTIVENKDGGYLNMKCEHVEVLKQMNRYSKMNGHKTNMYSIAVYTNIFECLKNDLDNGIDTIKNNIKHEIQHTVRNFVNKLQPANTQLLSVYVNEL